MNYLKPKLFYTIKSLINKGQDRSVKAKKNIVGGILIRGLGIAISLIFVPLTIEYINPSRYGIWLTLSSIVGWFSFFDIGLTQGLRNKFAEAIAVGDDEKAQIYVSTTYAILAIIFSLVWLLFLGVNSFIDWTSLLNIPPDMQGEISMLAVIVFTYFCMQFVFKVITTILTADQQPAKSSLMDLMGQAISLILVVILVYTTEGSLIKLGIALCVSPLLVLILANLYYFKGPYRKYRPVRSKIKFSYAKDLFNLGLVFFVIQIAGIIHYQSANFIIANYFGTSEVTSYNIVFKYFGIMNMGFLIFLSPFWSASTEAFMKNDLKWIKGAIWRYNLLAVLLTLLGLVMLVYADDVYRIWLGEGTVDISFKLSLWGFIYFVLAVFASHYVTFLNSISALRLQFLVVLISPVLYIALVLYMIKVLGMGIHCIFIAAVLANFNGYLVAPFQYYQIVHRSKKGIWIK